MIAEKLRQSILQAAISGQLTEQRAEDGTAAELLEEIAIERARLVQEGKLKKQKALPKIQDDEKPFEVPSSWRWERFANVLSNSLSFSGKDEEQVSFLAMSSISDGYSGNITPTTRLWKDVKSGYTKFRRGDLIIAKITPCFQNRKSAIVDNISSEFGAGTTELHVFHPPSSLSPRYALYFLKSEYVISNLSVQMTGSAGQKRVPTAAINKIPFPMPPLAEQERIVTKLDQLMPLIDELEKLERERENI